MRMGKKKAKSSLVLSGLGDSDDIGHRLHHVAVPGSVPGDVFTNPSSGTLGGNDTGVSVVSLLTIVGPSQAVSRGLTLWV